MAKLKWFFYSKEAEAHYWREAVFLLSGIFIICSFLILAW